MGIVCMADGRADQPAVSPGEPPPPGMTNYDVIE
jgi:hypothetical protein